MSEALLRINKGSDLTAVVVWPDTPTTPLDLTGWTVSVVDAHEALAGQLTATIGSAVAGRIDLVMVWADDMPLGALMSFRLRITDGAAKVTTPAIVIEVL